jgi:hypothetical protein
MTSPGPAQVFHTTPTSELITRFPLALVPTYLVPLAFVLHVIFVIAAARWRVGTSSSRVIYREPMTQPKAVFGISVLLGLVVWVLIDESHLITDKHGGDNERRGS